MNLDNITLSSMSLTELGDYYASIIKNNQHYEAGPLKKEFLSPIGRSFHLRDFSPGAFEGFNATIDVEIANNLVKYLKLGGGENVLSDSNERKIVLGYLPGEVIQLDMSLDFFSPSTVFKKNYGTQIQSCNFFEIDQRVFG